MKPIEKDKVTVTGNLTAVEEKTFGVSEDGLPHIYEMLSDIYQNPVLAVLRELTANGLDAQTEAGYTGPVEVFLPNSLNPVVKFVDHGTGMSVERLHDVYTNYGASTKRGTNTQVGMLGIGSKSPLAISDSFTIVTVCDGVKVTGQITKNNQGVGVLKILDTSTTDASSGTTITIPVATSSYDFNKWRQEAETLFKFWTPGSVLVDGVEPKFIEGVKINDRITVLDRFEEDYIVQGNIHYPVNRSHRIGTYDYSLLVNVPIGSVSFTPSRDALKYNDQTVEFLKRLKAEVTKELFEFVRNDVASATDKATALKKYWTWWNLGIHSDATFNGEAIPQDIPCNGFLLSKNYSGKYTRQDIRYIYLRDLGSKNTLFILNWDRDRPTTTFRKKLAEYMDSIGEEFKVIYFVPTSFDTSWITGVSFVDKADIDKIKLNKGSSVSRAGKGLGGGWKMINAQGDSEIVDDLPDGVFYYSPTEYIPIWAIAKFVGMGNAVVVAPRNRWTRIQRESSNSKPLTNYVIQKAFEITWDEDDIKYFKSVCLPNWLNFLSADDTLDPELKELLAYQGMSTTDNIKESRKLSTFRTHEPNFDFSWIGQRYPIMDSLYSFHKVDSKHVQIYVNAVYKTLEESE